MNKSEINQLEDSPTVDRCENVSDAKMPTHKSGLDDALQMAIDCQDEMWTAEEERKVLWKIDLTITPLLFLGTIVGYADSQAYGFAALFGLAKDLNLFTETVVNGNVVTDMTKYQLSAGIVSLGAAIGPYLLLLPAQLLPIGLVYSATLLYIGFLAILTIICHNFSQIMALRFFYGFSQVIQPLGIVIAVMWWKTKEQPLRIGLMIAGNAVGSLIGNGVDFGAMKLGGLYDNSRWKWIYVILGTCAAFAGVIVLALMPATPMKAWFLTDREKRIAVRRLMSNNTGIHTRKFKIRQALSAFLDPQLYALSIFSFTFAFSNVAVSSFGGFLVSSFGYSQLQALVLFMPASAIAVVCILLAAYVFHQSKRQFASLVILPSRVYDGVFTKMHRIIGNRFPNHRIVVAIAFLLPAMMGNILLWKSHRENKSALLAGLYLSTTFYGSLVQHYSLLAANIGGHSKKTTVLGTITMMVALGGFSGPWAYKGDQAAQGYPDGQIATLSLFCASILAYTCLWFYYTCSNKKKAALLRAQPDLAADPMVSFMDMTDCENPAFQYSV
ncbi:major facilitator superfamily domain-containing protein [Penicillium frequentans]|uniref:Major facilitator superfamily domain-containing protein n=1 Tax=Penicillium frequentans TaxID=3151616 RepID=A0AAD6GHS9_9EURO|nr:major facilitator superfamily domain-containing protein [Penicillium glabrum]